MNELHQLREEQLSRHENLPILPESNRRCTFSLSVQTYR